MANEPREQTEWRDCRPGEVSSMVGRIRSRRRRVFAMQLGGCAVFGIVLGIAFIELRPRFAEPPLHGGITCGDVRDRAELYIRGKLNPDLQDRIATHLKECPGCDRYVEKKRSDDGSLQHRPGNQRNAALSQQFPFAADF